MKIEIEHDLSYFWHWWINSLDPDGPAGCPHKKHLYEFKAMLESLGYFEGYLKRAFTDQLPQTHQQCSHQSPEPIKEKNIVRCALGVDVTQCPILLSLKESFEKNRTVYYIERVPEESVYALMARTCGWHLLMAEVQEGKAVDWNEGALQDTSDRMFWERTYQNLASTPEEESQ